MYGRRVFLVGGRMTLNALSDQLRDSSANTRGNLHTTLKRRSHCAAGCCSLCKLSYVFRPTPICIQWEEQKRTLGCWCWVGYTCL